MMPLFDFPGGIHPPENKAQSSATPIRQAPLPPQLHVALRQSMGNAARPCVAVGDRVAKGQLIASADGRLSAAVHAPTSGVVSAIAPQPFAHPSGLPELAITLDSDGEERWIDRQPLHDWPQRSGAEIRDFLAQMGIVGLGGAVFPSHLKLGVSPLETLVINGAECEPYISCDDRLMRERAAAICDGIAVTRHALQARQVLIGIEDNKPQAIAAMQAAAAAHGFGVVAVPTKYPSGGAKQLIRILTGKAIPHGVRATEHGVQCFNVATVYAIGRAVLHGEPLISRIVTLTGAVDAAANVEALIGTPLDRLLALAHPHRDSKEVVMGGPLMGFTLPDLAAGLTKAGNCLLVKSPALFPPRPPAQACIRCGDCASACPVSLQPMDLFWFAKAKNFDKAQQWQLFDCIECGACSYVCPSQIPLVDYYRFAKSEIWAAERDKNAANLARQRHEFRQMRLQRDKAEKAQRLADKAAQAAARQTASHSTATNVAANVAPGADPKQAAIAAAMARAAAQREAAPLPEQHSSGLNDAKQAAIAAAMARAAARKTAADEAKAASGQPPAPPPSSSGIDDAKQAAIAAAMARAAARKSAADEAKAASGQPPAPPPSSSGLDDAKQAAIDAAMARAAARKAAADQARANQQPDS
ncbi:electron transport complex subunit RsxC [Vogesella indigofera]|uniref:electron transport complex subunit RsxC n=1 Tax=Vogesella indigofera TaxID=45465 RepID=UPI00234DE38A|nr:electron transport complex subunit RsxC [Vogesella indigofera]MDC7704320.1 electron transport complex subunit RsxC [Vogesella indigofera]